MRVHLAIIFSLICGPAMADGKPDVTFSTTIPANAHPVSVGQPHTCADAYPLAAIQAHAEGTTTLTFTITANGTVRDIKIEKSSGNSDLDDAAAGCASHWLYRPATKDAVPVETPWTANVDWKLGSPNGARNAQRCLAAQKVAIPIAPDVGVTRITYRVMPDGKIKDVKLTDSSGNKLLDEAAMNCAALGRFDVSELTIPDDGISGHSEFDWNRPLPVQTPSAVSPPSRTPATPPDKI